MNENELKKLQDVQNGLNAVGIPDLRKMGEYREREEWYKGRAKAAGKAEEVVTVARTIIVENPTMCPEEALDIAEKFHTAAYNRVEKLLEGYKPEQEPKDSGIAII